jgi:hypothetical protein
MQAERDSLLKQLGLVAAWGAFAVVAGVVWSLGFSGAELDDAIAAEEIQVEVRTVAFDEGANAPVVVLHDAQRGRALPIWVGPFEAQAIAMEMEGANGARPLTHDLMKTIVERLDAKLDRVVIDDLREHTYFATIHLKADGGEVRIDSRPSDAIALALRFDRPILVNGSLLAGDAAVSVAPAAPEAAVARLWGLTLQDVTGSLAEGLALSASHGVLVSDVAPGAAAADVRRGDVITNINGAAVRTVGELEAQAQDLGGDAPVVLGLGRAGAVVLVRVDSPIP